jgi:hypothetical protein
MTSFVPILAFVCVFALMVWFLLDPSSLLNLMQSAIPSGARDLPPRYPHFAVIVIFATGIGFFYELGRSGIVHSLHPADTLQFYLLVFAAFFLAVNAVGACYWPIAFQRIYNPRLRQVNEVDLSPKTRRILEIFGRCWGVLLLISCSYLVHILSTA